MRARPLVGVRVVVTRTREQSADLVVALEELGAIPVPIPVIEITDPPDGGAALRAGLAELQSGDWVVVTSPNGASRVVAALGGRDLVAGVSVAAIGPGTRGRAQSLGLHVDLVPISAIAEGLLDALPSPGAGGGTMLLARAESARSLLPDGLAERGWVVRDIVAYRTVGVAVSADDATACRHADIAAFTSASTVRHLTDGVGVANLPPLLACIGPATARQAEQLGLDVGITAAVHTIPGLVTAIAEAVPNLVLVRPEPADAADSRWMREQCSSGVGRRFDTRLDREDGFDAGSEEIIASDGLFLAARLDGAPAGCGVLRTLGPGVAEISCLWVGDEIRGRGVGRRLLHRLVTEGRAMGLRRVELDATGATTEAIAHYRGEGFVEAASSGADPLARRLFALDLD